jgi:uncharacterized protein (TIGR02678 family)
MSLVGRNARARTDDQHLPYVHLLDRVAVFADTDRVAYERIRANLRTIRDWFSRHTGWAVTITPEFVRLVRPPARAIPGHGLAWDRSPSPRDYAMMTWILWYGERKNADQFTLTLLAKEIQDRANDVVTGGVATPGTGYIDWNVREHRASLRNAIVGLETMRLITHLEGDLRPYVDNGEGDALYEFTALASRFQATIPDALYDAIVYEERAAAIDELPVDDDREQFRVYRTLLLSPALFANDDSALFAYCRHHRRTIADALGTAFGWTLEVTGSYVCILRSAQDTRGRSVFPTQAMDTHLILLLANAIRAEVRAGTLAAHPTDDTVAISTPRLAQVLSGVAAEHRTAWSAELAALDSARLTARTLEALRLWGFADGPDQYDTVRILPVLGRFAGVYRQDGAGLDITPDVEDLDETALDADS